MGILKTYVKIQWNFSFEASYVSPRNSNYQLVLLIWDFLNIKAFEHLQSSSTTVRKMLNVRWLGGNPLAICIRTRPRRISCISPRISPICNWDFFHLQFVFLAASHLGFVPIWYLWAQIRQFVLGHSSRGLTVWLLCTNASPPGPVHCNALCCDTKLCSSSAHYNAESLVLRKSRVFSHH